LRLPDLYSVDSNILGLVSPESYHVGYPVTVALLNVWDYRSDNTVRPVAGVQMLTPVNSGRLSDQHGLVTVQMREDTPGFTIVEIGTILSLAHVIQDGDRRWLIQSRIDLRTFNEV